MTKVPIFDEDDYLIDGQMAVYYPRPHKRRKRK